MMPTYEIPPTATRFVIARANGGAILVVSDTSGTRGVASPCRDEAQARDVCARLNAGGHGGAIEVPLVGLPR